MNKKFLQSVAAGLVTLSLAASCAQLGLKKETNKCSSKSKKEECNKCSSKTCKKNHAKKSKKAE